MLGQPQFILFLVGLAGLIGLVAGSYPALVLSGFRPIQALKGEIKTGGKNWLTRGLVVAQYTLAIALIICAGIMTQQLDYLRNKSLGFDQEQVVVINTSDFSERSVATVETFKQAVSGYPQIVNVAGTGYSFSRSYDGVSWQEPDGTPRSAQRLRVDYDYLQTMDMKLVAGRNFSRDFQTDPLQAVIVNESFVKAFGWDDPVGQQLIGYGPDDATPRTVIGVVEDYHFRSLHEPIGPAFWHMTPDFGLSTIMVRIQPENAQNTLTLLEEKWAEASPNAPFNFYFLDEDIQQQYANETRWSKIVAYSTLFALLIACMGLLGLVALAVSKRTKEIGVRKVLGASVPSLVTLMSKDFLKLVLIATLLAWPLAYFSMNRWLDALLDKMNYE